jgi:DNA-binding MarR family transcriptional regulator
MNLDKQMSEVSLLPSQNWAKLISLSKKQFDEWTINRLASCGYTNFKIAYMPVLVNIKIEGIGNKELAIRVRVTKQAMSKVLKELLDLGYITSKVSKEDKRNSIISLTDKGKKLVILCRQSIIELMEEYRTVFGRNEFDSVLSMLHKIMEYNDQKSSKKP